MFVIMDFIRNTTNYIIINSRQASKMWNNVKISRMPLRVYTITPEKVLWTVFYYVALKEEKETGPS